MSADTECGGSSALHRRGDFVSVMACRGIGIATVGDDRPQLPEVAALAR